MRILITNLVLSERTGTEIYVKDLALALLARGHEVAVYAPALGPLADEMRVRTIPVIDDLACLGWRPDIIHGHHTLPTLSAMLYFSECPAVFVLHDWSAWHDQPPPAALQRLRRFIAVDEACRDRLVCENAIAPERTAVVMNAADLVRFAPRGPLPERPRRALVFSNYATLQSAAPLREACARAGIELDMRGRAIGESLAAPEEILDQYDLVFACGKCAIEALVTGAAVIVCNDKSLGGMTTSADLPRLRAFNFGRRCLARPLEANAVAAEIARFDAADAARVSAEMREVAGLDRMVESLLEIYGQAMAEQAREPGADPQTEARAVALFLQRPDVAQLVQQRGRLFFDAETLLARLAGQHAHGAANTQSQRSGLIAAVQRAFALPDDMFVAALYELIFQRRVDPPGFTYALGELRLGCPRREILRQLLDSPEAVRDSALVAWRPVMRSLTRAGQIDARHLLEKYRSEPLREFIAALYPAIRDRVFDEPDLLALLACDETLDRRAVARAMAAPGAAAGEALAQAWLRELER
jgi:hypothetical protein